MIKIKNGKADQEILGLDGISRTWKQIEDEYWELLNPRKYSNIFDLESKLQNISNTIYSDLTKYIPNRTSINKDFKSLFNDFILKKEGDTESRLSVNKKRELGIYLRDMNKITPFTSADEVYTKICDYLKIYDYSTISLIKKIENCTELNGVIIFDKLKDNDFEELKKLVIDTEPHQDLRNHFNDVFRNKIKDEKKNIHTILSLRHFLQKHCIKIGYAKDMGIGSLQY